MMTPSSNPISTFAIFAALLASSLAGWTTPAFGEPADPQADPVSSERPTSERIAPMVSRPEPRIEGAPPPALSLPSPIGTFEYHVARGLRVGDTGLNIGGFATVEMDREEGRPFSLALDSFNFLVLYEPIDAFRIFSELEIGDLFSYEAQGPTESDPRFGVERLYAELSLDDPFNLRFGKYQTPVGRWNLVPAEPFVWTALDPVTLDAAFDEHQTGVALTGTFFPGQGALEYWLYGQIIDPLDPSKDPEPASRSVGGRLQFTKSLESWSIGSSFLATQKRDEWSYLGGLDAEAQLGNFAFLGELFYQNGAIGRRDLIGVYAQGRYEIVRDVHLVARYEYFNRLGAKATAAHVGDLGFAWQPSPWLILKATYRLSTRETDDVTRGFASSISVIF